MHYYGVEGEYNVLVMELLGKSMARLLKAFSYKFSLITVLMFAIQAIDRLEYVHSKGYVHRDIKPQNFAIGHRHKSNIIYLLDYGLAKIYRDAVTKKHIAYKDIGGLIGTAKYASFNAHNGFEQSRRDDLESLGYLLVYFFRGTLPWNGSKAGTPQAKYASTLSKKLVTPLKKLCKDMPGTIYSFPGFYYPFIR
eukprot:TRINITY_DN630_c0_g1_i1.p2 TRINITY_DN630_c0_g1~~TRINITY_DN630_c0_g1_i1.p2  ORF type:complete len:194 (-),score=15.49 TRINITY_DN630_c0_g1_i1:634-1215(-)